MHTRIKFYRPLPLVVSLPGSVYAVWLECTESTGLWSVAASRLGDEVRHTITAGLPSRRELEAALHEGVELFPDTVSQSLAAELVGQNRAQYVDSVAPTLPHAA